MQPLKIFIDTHNTASGTFPASIDAAQFQDFFVQYEQACRAEGVVLMRVHTSLEAGRAFCLTMAENADAVRRAHERVGLPFEEIVEVMLATPGDIFFRQRSQAA